jgi:TolB-like protein
VQLRKFLEELKRRHVYRVAAAYCVVAWLLVQVAATIVPALQLPPAITTFVVLLMLFGFPVAVVLAWAFEFTPEGLKRSEDVAAPTRRRPVARKVVALFVTLAVGATGLLVFRTMQPRLTLSGSAHRAIEKSIAVLPFKNLSDDKENAFFADGVQEEILTTLAKVADLRVISRTSVMQYKETTDRNLPQIAQALNVAHVLEGSVRRDGNRVRVTAQLIDAETDAHLWAKNYDRDLADVFAIQSEIAHQIAQELRAVLSPSEKAAIARPPTSNIIAYDLYLRARELERSGRATLERIQQEIALLDQAVALDPDFVPALCLLAREHFRMFWTGHDRTEARLDLGRKALEVAARIAPDAGEVHLTRGILHYWGTRDFPAALAQLALARAKLPNDPDPVFYSATIERRQGRWEESTRLLEAAAAMDPRNATILVELATTNYMALRRYGDAARVCDSILQWKRDFASELARARVDRLAAADLQRMEALMETPAAKAADPQQLALTRLDLAFAKRDFAAAEQILAVVKGAEFPGGGYVTPREWYEALVAEALGNAVGAQSAFNAARARAAAGVAKRPDDAKLLMILAEIDARLGRKEEAIRQAERAVEMLPISEDAFDGVRIVSRLAAVYGRLGDKSRALEMLAETVVKPSGPHYGELMLDERWDPVRDERRFQEIVASVAPQQPAKR